MDIGKPPARIPSWLALSQLGVDGLKSRGGSSENLECLQYADESEQQQECPQASPPMPIPNR